MRESFYNSWLIGILGHNRVITADHANVYVEFNPWIRNTIEHSRSCYVNGW